MKPFSFIHSFLIALTALGILLASRYMVVKSHLSQERSQNEVKFSFHPQVETAGYPKVEQTVQQAPEPKPRPQIQKTERVPQIKSLPKAQPRVMTASFRKIAPKPEVIEIVNPQNIKYEIQPGDRLDKISNKFYGTHHRWKELVQANPGLDPSKIRPGQMIIIPAGKTNLPKQESVYLNTHTQNKRPYKVRDKDLLGIIAQRELGSVKHVPKILALNPGLDPARIRPGQTIFLPTTTIR